MNGQTKIKVMLLARDIPLGSTVTKCTGQKPYVIRDEVAVYGLPDKAQKITSDDVRFLFPVEPSGSINAVNGGEYLAWTPTRDELLEFLQADQEAGESHQ